MAALVLWRFSSNTMALQPGRDKDGCNLPRAPGCAIDGGRRKGLRAGMEFRIALLLLTVACVACVWLGSRRPGTLLAIVLASFAIGPQWVLAGYLPKAVLALALPAQKGLLIVALVANLQRFGVRPGLTNWPLLAVLLLALQSLLLADPDPRRHPGRMALSALDLALPWCLAQMIVAPGSRARLALLLAALTSACVAAGLVLDLMDVRSLYFGSSSRGLRLHGATNAGWLAFLAFAGFAIALHEALQRRHRGMALLAAVNLALVWLTGGRMGIAACGVFALAYRAGTRPAAARSRRVASAALGLGALALLVLVLLDSDRLEQLRHVFSLTGRDTIWLHYLRQVQERPLFGHGLGAGLLGASYYDLPHNEYLRLLVEGGIAGLLLYGGAVVLWGRRVLARVDAGERAFLRALFAALAVYALTDNILTMTPGLVPFVYLALMLGEPYAARPHPAAAPACVRPGTARSATPGA
jgi:O-antigen ligase